MPAGRLEINVVEACRHVADDEEARGLLQDIVIYAIGQQRENAVTARRFTLKFIARRR